MTGERVYALYCKAMAALPYRVTNGEALPSWEFVGGELREAWEKFGSELAFVPIKPKPKPIAKKPAAKK